MVAGRYRLIARLGVGATSQVFSAEDLVLGRRVALKRLRPCGDPTAAARLRDEARIASEMHHPNIAEVYDCGEDLVDGEPRPYVVMELVEGRPLREVLRDGCLPPARVAAILAQIADALAHAHSAGVVHRDIKPGNIVLTPSGDAVLLDFGIARRADMDPLTQTGTIVGTVDYLSPEQAAGQSATPRSDLYALGLVAYESLTGVRALTGTTIPETLAARTSGEVEPLPREVPPALKALVEWMVRRDPAQRPADAEAVARLASDPSILGATALAPRRQLGPWSTTGYRIAAAAVVAALISVSGLLLAATAHRDGAPASAATAHQGTLPATAASPGVAAASPASSSAAQPTVVSAVVTQPVARRAPKHADRRVHRHPHRAAPHAPGTHGHRAHGLDHPHGRGHD